MRGILKFAAIVAVMVAARYVPAGEAIRGLVDPAKPAIVTGSIQDQQKGDTPRDPVRRTRDAAADVRAILAQDSSEKASNNNAPPQRRPARNRGREDETDDDGEIYIGGTGLLDEDHTAAKEHPLAAKHPEDYLVICEAGCRPSSDRIVYKISKTSAVNAEKAQRKLQVTSGAEGTESNENSEIVCLAGCYDDEPVKQRRAERMQQPAVHTAEAETPAPDEPKVETKAEVEKQLAADAPKAVAQASPPAPETPPAAAALTAEAPASAVSSTASMAIGTSTGSTTSAAVAEAVVTTIASPSPVPVSAALQPAVIAEATSVRDLAAIHAISAEAAARREAKRAASAAPSHQKPWQTKVTSLVMLPKPAKASRSVVALSTVAPFETSVAVEHGWDFTLSNTP